MNLSKENLKRLCYVRFGPTLNDGYVEYVVNGRICVFTGVTKSRSTINAAEAIIMLIAEAEQVRPNDLVFYDLQTHLGYGRKEPGEFEFSQVSFYHDKTIPDVIEDDNSITFTGGPVGGLSWKRASCPDWVKQLFDDHIGPDPLEQLDPFDSKRRRKLKALYTPNT